MRPFFSYYGGKWRSAPRYPRPLHNTIIEPFAGSAGYSVRYPDRNVILYDTDEKITGTWDYLISASADEIRALPDIADRESVDTLAIPQEARWLIGWWLGKGRAAPGKTPSQWMRSRVRPNSYWGAVIRERIAGQVDGIRHWRVVHGSYDQAPDISATWFIDPPYQAAPGSVYTHGNERVDFRSLAEWCRSRVGQVMVCENTGADWLPFQPFMAAKATPGRDRNGVSKEAMWIPEYDGEEAA